MIKYMQIRIEINFFLLLIMFNHLKIIFINFVHFCLAIYSKDNICF